MNRSTKRGGVAQEKGSPQAGLKGEVMSVTALPADEEVAYRDARRDSQTYWNYRHDPAVASASSAQAQGPASLSSREGLLDASASRPRVEGGGGDTGGVGRANAQNRWSSCVRAAEGLPRVRFGSSMNARQLQANQDFRIRTPAVAVSRDD